MSDEGLLGLASRYRMAKNVEANWESRVAAARGSLEAAREVSGGLCQKIRRCTSDLRQESSLTVRVSPSEGLLIDRGGNLTWVRLARPDRGEL